MMDRKCGFVCVTGLMALAIGMASVAEAQLQEPEQRFYWSVDGGGQSGSQQLQDSGVTGQVFGEGKVVDTDYDIDRGAGLLRSNVTFVLWKNLGIGLGFTRTASDGTADVTVQVPHPVFVNRPRVGSRSLTALGHRENMYHLRAVWVMPLDDRVDLQIYGGPTIMRAEQAIVTDVVTGEVGFPFTDIAIARVRRTEIKETGLGFNVGLDFAYMLGDNYGIGGFVQYAGGSLDYEMAGGPTSVTIGGLQYGGGLRLRF